MGEHKDATLLWVAVAIFLVVLAVVLFVEVKCGVGESNFIFKVSINRCFALRP
jgi:hypothetical protein